MRCEAIDATQVGVVNWLDILGQVVAGVAVLALGAVGGTLRARTGSWIGRRPPEEAQWFVPAPFGHDGFILFNMSDAAARDVQIAFDGPGRVAVWAAHKGRRQVDIEPQLGKPVRMHGDGMSDWFTVSWRAARGRRRYFQQLRLPDLLGPFV